MTRCDWICAQLPQYIADGEPQEGVYGVLRAHLESCAACRAYAEELRVVESALRAYPLVAADAGLAVRIHGTLLHEDQVREEPWHLLPWDVWVPILAFGLALLVALLSLPPQLSMAISAPMAGGPADDLAGVFGSWSASFEAWSSAPLFWPIWIGVFATLAGLGLSISLTCWTAPNSRPLGDLESRLSQAASRLSGPTRHTR